LRHLYEKVSEGIFTLSGLTAESYREIATLEELATKLKFANIEEIDAYYKTHITILFGEIIDFATKAQVNNDEKYADNFYQIKVLSRSLIDIYKIFEYASGDFSKYSRQSDTAYGKIYLEMINDILQTLSDITMIDASTSDMQKVLEISKLKLIMQQHDILKNGVFNTLVEKEEIPLEISTSLINDTNYKNEIITKLLQIFPYITNKHFIKDADGEISTKKIFKWFLQSENLEIKNSEKIIQKLKTRKKSLKLKIKHLKKESPEYEAMKTTLNTIEQSILDLKK